MCPYCSTRNAPGSSVCNHCGAILRDIKRARPAPKEKHALGSAAKSLFGGGKLRAQHASVVARIKSALTAAQERAEKELEKQGASAPDTGPIRLTLGNVHLLHDEIERSIQEYQQAQRAGTSGPEFHNNAGIALARRGGFKQAVEMFDRAVGTEIAPTLKSVTPRTNLAHALTRLSVKGSPKITEQALLEVQNLLSVEAKNAAHYNRLGVIFCAEGRFDEAQVQFGRARDLARGDDAAQADASNNLGVALAQGGDTPEAAGAFDDALKLDPSHGRALCNRALVHFGQGEAEAALEKLQRAARLDPKSALIRSNHGYALSRALAINEGIREFKEAILLDAQPLEPYYNQAKSYVDEGLGDIAERYLTRALQVNTECWQALVALGVIKFHQGSPPLALQSFQSANGLHPNEPLIMKNLALCLALTGAENGAERLLKQAGQVAKDDPEVNLLLAWIYLRRKSITQSMGELQIALGRDDRLAIGHNNLGLCQIEMGNYDDALLHFRRALQLDPDLAPVHYHLGGVCLLMNQLDSAIREWEQASHLEPANADCLCNLGVAHFKQGKLDQAVTEFRRVVNLRTDRMADWSNLGLAYAKQGSVLRAAARRPDDAKAQEGRDKQKVAIEMFDRAIAIDARNVMLHSNRGLACYFANEPEAAMREWTLVTKLDSNYARRRGAAQQSEFDETVVEYVPIDTAARALPNPVKTPDYLFRYVFGYDLDDWNLILGDPALAAIPDLARQARRLERQLNALQA